jgi:hypothetical protein
MVEWQKAVRRTKGSSGVFGAEKTMRATLEWPAPLYAEIDYMKLIGSMSTCTLISPLGFSALPSQKRI